ncbi:MAG: dolichyl-phosphate-mannose-protein mannosyltransferase [Firmicutes bacterium]|nr:dolichyl-phosphate-mannose-protein mannosyltransferase [Bacillota bacterium]
MEIAHGLHDWFVSRRWAAILAAAVLGNLIYNAALPLHFDEAYYWVWSNHLQLSYFDHPPMIAWLIRLATIFGDSEWQIRLVPLFCSTLTGLGIWHLSADMFGKAVAGKALLIFLLSPLAQMGFTLATPDAPLILGWMAVVFFVYQAIFKAKRRCYYAAGAAAGFALLSKYTAVLLLPGVLLFLIFSSHRGELRRKELFASLGLALLVFLPVIVWNAGHDWSSFRFQLGHGLAGERNLNISSFAEYLGVQAAALNPIFFFFLVYVCWKNFRLIVSDDRQAFLLWPCIMVLGFFGYAALFKRVEGNWAAPAYITGIILIAKWVNLPRYTAIYKTGIALGVLLMLLLKVPELFGFIPPQIVMKRQVLGYDVMFREGGRYVSETALVLASDYKLASLAWYYLPGHPAVQILTPARFSQFDYWRKDLNISAGSDAVFFGDKTQATQLAAFFAEVEPIGPLSYNDRYVSREIAVFQCRGFKPTPGLSSDYPPFH